MAHFAELNENNVVLRVIVVNNNELFDGEENESEQLGIDFCVAHFGGQWIQTSYNGNFRGCYAGIGFLYDPNLDIFVDPFVIENDPVNDVFVTLEVPTE